VSDATDADLVLAAMGGAFSGVAYETDLNDIQVVLDRFVREFVLLAGQLPVVADYDASRPGLDVILNQAVSLLTLVLDDADADDVIAAINAQFSRWADHAVTEADASSDAVAAAVADAKVLLDDLDHYLTLAGIDSTAAFLATQM